MSEPQTGKGRGCFFYGCLTLVVLFLVTAVGLFFGVRYAVNRMVEQYTAAAPMAIPKAEATPEEIKVVQDQFSVFRDAIAAGQPAKALALSQKDLNLLINNSPALTQFKDNIFVTVQSNAIKATLSLPLESLGIKKLKGRYLNGAAEVKAALANGALLVTLQSLEVNGKPVPEQMMAGIRQQNLAKDVYKDAKSMQVLERLDSIEVKDGKVVVTPRNTTQ
jgi:hypothetical protein